MEADFAAFESDLRPDEDGGPIERDALIVHLKAFFQRKRIDADWEAIEKANDQSLVTALSMACPFPPPEKQALLEAADFVARARVLAVLLQMGGQGDDDTPVKQ